MEARRTASRTAPPAGTTPIAARPFAPRSIAALAVAALAVAALAVAALAAAPPAAADVVPQLVTGEIAGTCETVLVAGARAACAAGPVRFLRHPSRGTRWTVPLEDGRELVFLGFRDDRPAPGEYRLQVTRVSVSDGASPPAEAAVTGECRAALTPDGRAWHRLACPAHDAAGTPSEILLRGDGRRTTFRQRGTEVEFPVTPGTGRR